MMVTMGLEQGLTCFNCVYFGEKSDGHKCFVPPLHQYQEDKLYIIPWCHLHHFLLPRYWENFCEQFEEG